MAYSSRRSAEAPVATVEPVSGMEIELDLDGLAFRFGPSMRPVDAERRRLEDVRAGLMDPQCDGPDEIYTIYMDFARRVDYPRIVQNGMLYGGVIYAAGAMGREFVRSQGHIHTANEYGIGYPEVYEFWYGRGLLFMQKGAGENAADCRVTRCGPGDVAIVPPGWIHLTVNIGCGPLAFGAWCARKQGFDYRPVRERQGAAWYFLADGSHVKNPRYRFVGDLKEQSPRDYPELNIRQGRPIYQQYLDRPNRLRFMSHPHEFMDAWASLER